MTINYKVCRDIAHNQLKSIEVIESNERAVFNDRHTKQKENAQNIIKLIDSGEATINDISDFYKNI